MAERCGVMVMDAAPIIALPFSIELSRFENCTTRHDTVLTPAMRAACSTSWMSKPVSLPLWRTSNGGLPEMVRAVTLRGTAAVAAEVPTSAAPAAVSTTSAIAGRRIGVSRGIGISVGQASAYASMGMHEQTRLRSPCTESMRPTGGQYFEPSMPGSG